jgi:hypothetical protein
MCGPTSVVRILPGRISEKRQIFQHPGGHKQTCFWLRAGWGEAGFLDITPPFRDA